MCPRNVVKFRRSALRCNWLLGPAAWLVLSHTALGGVPLNMVALTGRIAPGTGGATFSFLDQPVLSNTGDVAFYGQVDDGDSRGIWVGLPGSLEIAAQTNGIAPGTGGAQFEDFAYPILSPGGKLAFGASLMLTPMGPTENDNGGIWAGSPSAVELIVREGTIHSEVDFGFFSLYRGSSRLMTINDAGLVASLSADVRPSAGRNGIWVGGPEILEVVALEGTSAPGTSNDFQFLSFTLALDDSGHVAFAAVLRGATSSENTGNWFGPAGGVELLARNGQMAPEAEPLLFGDTPPPDINSDGTAVFASLLLERLSSTTRSGLWVGRPGSLELFTRTNLEAPGTGGANFDSMISPPLRPDLPLPLINSNDVIAFVATLEVEPGVVTPDDDLGLWRGTSNDLELLVRKGSVAHGTGGAEFLDFRALALNGKDDVAFTADLVLEPNAVTEDNDQGLWVNVDGVTSLVVREGQLVDVDPTIGIDLREVEEILFMGGSGGEDGRRLALNDRQTVLFQLQLTDGSSGIFTAKVPEPSAVAHLILGLVCFSVTWRFSRGCVHLCRRNGQRRAS